MAIVSSLKKYLVWRLIYLHKSVIQSSIECCRLVLILVYKVLNVISFRLLLLLFFLLILLFWFLIFIIFPFLLLILSSIPLHFQCPFILSVNQLQVLQLLLQYSWALLLLCSGRFSQRLKCTLPWCASILTHPLLIELTGHHNGITTH